MLVQKYIVFHPVLGEIVQFDLWLTDHSTVLKPPPSSARFYIWFARIPSSFPANADLTKNLVLGVLLIEHNSMWFNKLIHIAQPEIRFSCRSVLELMLPLVYNLWKDTRVHRYHGLKNISPLETTTHHCISFFVQIAQTQALTHWLPTAGRLIGALFDSVQGTGSQLLLFSLRKILGGDLIIAPTSDFYCCYQGSARTLEAKEGLDWLDWSHHFGTQGRLTNLSKLNHTHGEHLELGQNN